MTTFAKSPADMDVSTYLVTVYPVPPARPSLKCVQTLRLENEKKEDRNSY